MNKQLYVVVQAGGRGSRLRHHTWNKPKCLVSVNGKPILYHLFDSLPNAKFIIIGDYKYEELEQYLTVNKPPVEFSLMRALEKGTASGIADAIAKVPADAPLVITWSDLVVNSLPEFPETTNPVVAVTSSFKCRWTVGEDGKMGENPGFKNGIPGIFYFAEAQNFKNPPNKGEFVKWFSKNIPNFEILDCPDLDELGDYDVIEASNDRAGFCRFFNQVEVTDTEVKKLVVVDEFQELHQKEKNWYREAAKLGFRRIPEIKSYDPLIMQRIKGEHPYQMSDLTVRETRALLADYLDALISLHDLGKKEASSEDIKDVYINKTISRVESVSNVIPNFSKDSMTINGIKCRNIFTEKNRHILDGLADKLMPEYFTPIHGDSTFSNTLVDEFLRVWFIDPRGYFSKPGIYGDPNYDFAKVYYSAVGGYDLFNRRKFKLHIDPETVEIMMDKPIFADEAENVFKSYFGKEMGKIKVLHGLIWIALSGYAKDDFDSIIGSFYLGLYWLEKGLEELA